MAPRQENPRSLCPRMPDLGTKASDFDSFLIHRYENVRVTKWMSELELKRLLILSQIMLICRAPENVMVVRSFEKLKRSV